MTSPGLAYWADAVFDRATIDAEALARMTSHARFGDACLVSMRNTLVRFKGDPLAQRMARDISRVFYGIFTLHIHESTGLTLSTIQDFCVETGLASRGRAAAILIQLRMIGYVIPDPAPKDRRTRRYIPAPAMTDAFRGVFQNELFALSVIEPEAELAARRLDAPEFFGAFVLQLGKSLANVAKNGERTNVTLFAERNGGLGVLFQLAASGAEGDEFPPKGPVPMSVASLARQFGISRSHVLLMLRDAAGQGLLRRDPETGTGFLEEPLRRDLIYFQAATFMGNAACAYRALQAVGDA